MVATVAMRTQENVRAASPAHPASLSANLSRLFSIIDSHLQIPNAIPHAFFMRHSL
jgi:hypothetical protein